MKKVLCMSLNLIFISILGTITDRSDYSDLYNANQERYLKYEKSGYTQQRIGFEQQEFRNRTPFDLHLIIYLEGGEVRSLKLPKNHRGFINTNLLCTKSFVIYPTSRLPGERTPDPTTIYVNECNDRITFIKYDYAGYFYSMTAHKI